MSSKIALEWIGGQSFQATDEQGTLVRLGGAGAEPPAMRPMHMVLAALAGCAALGVQSILDKQRQTVTALRFEVEGERQPEPPTTFTRIHVRVIVRGHHLDQARVERAVQLTEEKYCSVYALLRQAVPIETTVVVEEG